MPVARYLVDTSAWVRYPEPDVGARVDELLAAGAVATCAVVELRLLSAIGDAGTYARVARLRWAALQVLETTQADFRRALEIQATLAEREQTGVAWSDLVVAATAERHGAVLLHRNGGFDVVASIAQQATDSTWPPSGFRQPLQYPLDNRGVELVQRVE